MKLPAALIPALLATLALAACSSTVSVSTTYDSTADFNKYKTYTIAPAPNGETLSQESENALREAVRAQLAARGVTEAQSGKGDLAIVRHVLRQDQVSEQQYSDWGYGTGGRYGAGARYGNSWPYGYGSYGMWTNAPTTYTEVKNYAEGTLILDVVDTQTNQLVFRGTATAVVRGQTENSQNIRDAVARMVAALPAKK